MRSTRSAQRREVKVVPLGVSVFTGCEKMPVRSAIHFRWPLTAQLRSRGLGVFDIQLCEGEAAGLVTLSTAVLLVCPFSIAPPPQATPPHSLHPRKAHYPHIHPSATSSLLQHLSSHRARRVASASGHESNSEGDTPSRIQHSSSGLMSTCRLPSQRATASLPKAVPELRTTFD